MRGITKRGSGFTLIEVMIAVVVLSLVATAALKLVIMAQNGLAASKEREKLLAEAAAVQLELRLNQIRGSGKSGDIEWKTEDKEEKFFDKDFGKLKLDVSEDDTSDQVRFENVKWKEIEVTKERERKMVLYLPYDITAAVTSEDAVSADQSSDNSSHSSK